MCVCQKIPHISLVHVFIIPMYLITLAYCLCGGNVLMPNQARTAGILIVSHGLAHIPKTT